MPPARVGVIGAGVAGPVLAAFLKQHGYDPVVYERNSGPSDGGLGLGLQQNGLSVLAKVPGLLDYIGGFPPDEFHFYSVVEEDVAVLGITDHLRRQRESGGLGVRFVARAALQERLAQFLADMGMPVKWGHKLETLEQDDNSVTVSFANGVKETFSIVVGCDGLHSGTRQCLFGMQQAEYMGISQWGGLSPTPELYRGKAICGDIYGNGAQMVFVPVSDTVMHWAISQREAESKETWKAMDVDAAEDFKKNSRFTQWGFGAGELVRTATKIIKYGLYGRPKLERWHKGRVVLIGDAAHPTSPHVGQGANQSFEDVDLLIQLLQKHNPAADSPSTYVLEVVCTELERVRVPRTSEMIELARKQGETRVAEGVDACISRNNYYRQMCQDESRFRERFGC